MKVVGGSLIHAGVRVIPRPRHILTSFRVTLCFSKMVGAHVAAAPRRRQRVVYLEYTIPPRATLSSLNAAQSGRVEEKSEAERQRETQRDRDGRKEKRKRKRVREKERERERERKRQDLCMEGGSRGIGAREEGGGRRRPSATNAHH